MTVPTEYQRARDEFYAFLVEARDRMDLGSNHVAYTAVQGVFQNFRRRLSLEDAIRFSGVLPVGLRALFIADWDPKEAGVAFTDRASLAAEVTRLRKDHNFAPDNAIDAVAIALRNHVDRKRFEAVLATLPDDAQQFWALPDR